MNRAFALCVTILWVQGSAFAEDAVSNEAIVSLPPPASLPVEFERDIQPILARCTSCHGAEKQSNGLRLDRGAAAMRGGDAGAAILPGNSVDSLLIRYVAGLEEGKRMPPKGEPLTPQEIGVLRAWIDAGAAWPEAGPAPSGVSSSHWAFKTPERPAVPKVANASWVRNPIDAFVLAKLESLGIAPSPEADRATLLRRLSLDLTGLPPSPEDVETFVNDTNPYAYESAVNRLLASVHFGEQWGRHWLDIARYADSDGFEKDLPRPHAWRYRQWVIDALNRDMPYDQFLIEQLAGDLLPNATTEQKVATGFHRNTLTNREGGVDPEQFRVEQVVDRVNTTGQAIMGLTLGCAQCHTHKYDPITHREYYQMFAFFNTSVEVDIPAPLAPEVEAYKQSKERHDKEHAELQKRIDDYKPELAARLPQWEADQRVAEVKWQPLQPASFVSAGGATFTALEDASLLVAGNTPEKDTYTIVATTDAVGITGIRLEVLPDAALPAQGPGRSSGGNFVLSEFAVKVAPLHDPTAPNDVTLKAVWSDYAQEKYPLADAIDGKLNTGWSVGGEGGTGAPRVAVFGLPEPAGFPQGSTLAFTLEQRYGQLHTIGRLRISITTAEKRLVEIPEDVRAIMLTSADTRDSAQTDRLLEYFGTHDAHMRELRAALEAHAKGAPQPPATLAQTLAESPNPPKTHVHIRGDFLRPGDEVQPGTLEVLPPLKPRGERADRLDLARWLVDPVHPLTARVAVNRMWERLFERGLVYTSEDFGTRGEPPSHPELLDWLACEMLARGWSMKDMLRLMVLSSTYRQSSHIRPELMDRDPRNVWLARQSRFRVSAENVRDLALAASGLLNPAVGGPSVRPAIPPGVTDLGYANSVQWKESEGVDRYRRGIYIFFQRTVPYPMLMTFDCPDSNVTAVRRARSNTPLQALTLMNDPVFTECAQSLGRRLLSEVKGDDTQRIRRACLLALGRTPTQDELDSLVRLVKEQRGIYGQDATAAAMAAGPATPAGIAPDEAAAWMSLSRVLLNLDEFVTRE